MIDEFRGKTIEDWESWYLSKEPNAIKNATKKILGMIENYKSVLSIIDEEMIERWVKDLVIGKTFFGLKGQKAILEYLASELKLPFKLATADQESKGIDGIIGNTPVSIKPFTYKIKKGLPEEINVKIIFYKKNKNNFEFEYNQEEIK